MNAENFVYWLQGFLELSDEEELHEHQLDTIREHIALVLTKIEPCDPSKTPPVTTGVREAT